MKDFNDLHYEHFCSTMNTYLQPQNLPSTSAAAKQQGGNWLINSQFMPLMTDFLLPEHLLTISR